MKPVKFEQQNATYAENQHEYLPLPVYRTKDGLVVSCWGMSWRERFRAFFHGKVWLEVMTFNKPLQPQRLSADLPAFPNKTDE